MSPTLAQIITINIGVYETLGLIGALIAGAWYASHRLTKVETKVDGIETRITNLEGRLDQAFASSSPLALLPKGLVILQDSGLKKYIDERKDELLSHCEAKDAMHNQYDIQTAAFKFFDQLNFGDFEEKLKEASFKHGVSMATIRRIGGIYFRDLCLKAKGFEPADLDKPKSPQPGQAGGR